MDINKYLEQSLQNQARQIALQEAILEVLKDINENGVFIANADDAPVMVALHGATTVNMEPVGVSLKEQAQQTAQETVQQPAQEQAAQETKPAAEPVQEKKPKGPSIDDARAALKKFAAIEGNDAAMDLLTALKATSVTNLAEQGGDALQKLIDKCEGK